MKKQILSFLLIAVVFFIFYACSAPGGAVGAVGGSTGTININFGSAAGRAPAGRLAAVTSDGLADGVLDELTHKVTLTKGFTVVERDFKKGETSAVIQIEAGDWSVSVEAFCYGFLFASGESNVQVMAGQSSPVSVQMQAQQDTDFYAVSSEAEWKDVFDEFTSTSGDKVVLITKDITVSTGASIQDGNITICGDKTVSYTGMSCLLSANVNGNVVLYDTKLTTIRTTPVSDPLVKLDLGSLTMKGSSSISGNYNSNEGGGVNVDGGSFTMEDDASVYGNTAKYGGGVAVVSGGTFTMKGNSKVYDNTATDGAGGVYVVNGGTFSIQDNVSIYGNIAGSNGGGVYVDDGTFTMQGGTIAGNKANDSGSGGGGGVYVYGNFFISNGIVYGSNEGSNSNLLNNSSGSGSSGAALKVSSVQSMAQYGTFNGSVWTSNGDFSTAEENTINIVNGQRL